MKYAILISHPLYGSCYPTKSGVLTKDICEAETFDTYDEADSNCPKMKELFECECYVQTVPRKF